MDVLNAVVNMIHQPRVALYAQEALLVALNMCDTRIDRFVHYHTRLVEDMVAELCKRFQAALEAANEALATPSPLYNGLAAGINSNLGAGTAGRGQLPASASPAVSATTATSSVPAASSNTSSALLSPLSKVPSFTLGSSKGAAQATPSSQAKGATGTPFYSPAASAALSYLYGGGGGGNSAALAHPAAAGAVSVTRDATLHGQTGAAEHRSSPMQVVFLLVVPSPHEI